MIHDVWKNTQFPIVVLSRPISSVAEGYFVFQKIITLIFNLLYLTIKMQAISFYGYLLFFS